MMQTNKTTANPLLEIAQRIREMREIVGYTTAEMAENAKYLVCMTGSHYDRLCELFPDCADKIFTLLPEDISDPFGGDLATYRRSAAEIDKGVQAVIKNLSR